MSDCRRLVDALRAAGLTVHEYPGADGRSMDDDVPAITIKGAVIHHTATPFDWNISGLVSSTRPDMPGATLANFSGNPDGSVTYLASGVAWHAGAGSGPSLGPLYPWRNAMNYYTVGLEIVYPGSVPMTAAQYRTALIFARVVADTFAGGDLEYVRAHAETNGVKDGKWDPGYAPNTTINMTAFRAEAAALTPGRPSVTEREEAVSLVAHPVMPGSLWSSVVVPPVGGSLSTGPNGEAWIHLHVPNQAATVEVWASLRGDGLLMERAELQPDAYWSRRIPAGVTALSFRHIAGRVPVSAVIETYRRE